MICRADRHGIETYGSGCRSRSNWHGAWHAVAKATCFAEGEEEDDRDRRVINKGAEGFFGPSRP